MLLAACNGGIAYLASDLGLGLDLALRGENGERVFFSSIASWVGRGFTSSPSPAGSFTSFCGSGIVSTPANEASAIGATLRLQA
jgi:hypothetical protein